ncbi:histone H1.8 [Motacilla alba alba]|uniref:histone H1.8 n=1 Tax=Motacilla alba alba TaxID=1094192 RepID=UPI0018D52DD7|nr:histone H1.8 [Motacilla alba alba]
MVPLPAAKAAGIAPRCQAQHPPTLQMIKEALQAHDEKKGASVVAIKRFILAKYPTVDPIRLKYMLKQALSKGLSCGELVRPHNSTAVGATGTFKLALKKSVQKKQLGQTDVAREQAPKPGQKGTPKDPQAPTAAARRRGATKQQPKVKPVKAQPRAAEKSRSKRAKQPQTADQPQAHDRAHDPGPSGPPKAAGHRQAPRKGRSGPSTAQAAESTGGSDSDSSASAGVGGPQKAPRGKSKGKVPKGAQRGAPKAQGGQDKAKKPRVTAGAGQGKARMKKAAPVAADRKAP